VTLNHVGKAIFDPIPGLTEDQRWHTQTVVIAPGVLLVLMPDSVIALGYRPTGPTSMRVKRHRLYPAATLERPDFILWFILLPRSPGRTEIIWSYAVPKDVAETPQFDDVLELVHRGVEAFNIEDFPINSGMQIGLKSRLAQRGRYSVEEETAAQVARWAIQRYRAEDERARARA
jgi:hypothetical protein